MDVKEEFHEHTAKAKALFQRISKKDKVELYGLYMHSMYGPVMTPRPGLHNMKDPEEWDAWKAVEEKSTEEAMREYIDKVKQLHATAHAS